MADHHNSDFFISSNINKMAIHLNRTSLRGPLQ